MMFNNASSSPAPSSMTSTKHQTTAAMTSFVHDAAAAGQHYRFNPYDADHSKVFIAADSEGNEQPPHSYQSIGHASSRSSTPRVTTPTKGTGYFPVQYQDQHHQYQHQMQWHQNQLQYQHQYHQYPTEQEQEDQYQQDVTAPAPVFTRLPPQGTLHRQLIGRINFCLYPTVAFENLEPTLPKHQMVRMFIGQLPYHVTAMQLGWLLYTFGNGAELYHFERITKTDHTKGGIKVPTGCFHFHMRAEQVAPLLETLNDRLLVDDTGIWVTETAEERHLLANYCYGMKRDKTRRFQGRPYGTVVAQRATSTFDPDTFTPAHSRAPGAFRHHF